VCYLAERVGSSNIPEQARGTVRCPVDSFLGELVNSSAGSVISDGIGGPVMLLEYIQAALRHASYEILPDDGSYYGEIPECNGVYANAKTLEDCREELREVMEEWVFFRIHKNLPLPEIDGIELVIKEVA
jgi:predicted RNase H-like HicB family nuclease